MRVYNYTKVKRREKRVYSFMNQTISQQGVLSKTIASCAFCLVFFNIFGLIVCAISGKFLYNPALFVENEYIGYFWAIFIFLPIAIGAALNSLKVQNYLLWDYIKIYLKPKSTIDQNGKRVKLTEYHIETFIENIH